MLNGGSTCGLRTTQIFSLEIMPTEAVQPETSSSYLGSDRIQSLARIEDHDHLTVEYGSVGGEEPVLQSLFQFALCKTFLLRNDLVYVLPSELGNLLSSVAIVDPEVC